MTEQTVAEALPVTTDSPSPASMPGRNERKVTDYTNGSRNPRQRRPAKPRPPLLDEDQELALEKVIKNYNDHRGTGKGSTMSRDLVYISAFTRWDKSWTAEVRSTISKRLRWVVTFDHHAATITIDVLSRIDGEVIELG